jgi:hypothetical protein
MPYITREDGEHFVIPSYRDVLSAKQKSLLKKDILLLSQSYGEYITLQRKNVAQYEVAFSPDTGYLLGESIWHHFKRPLDMIYCEAIPNTTEAILVIVKSGSVYLDGSFPLDSIPEELIIFLTQQNNFEIYIYGDVPISQTPQEGKFNFEAASVKSFTVLDEPVFPTLPLLKIYQLQLVDVVLKAQGIGVFPVKKLLTGIVVLGVLYMMYSYMTSQKTEVQQVAINTVNPYQGYITALSSPAPDQEINQFINSLQALYTMPGWTVGKIDYAKGTMTAAVKTSGSKIEYLMDWAQKNNAKVNILPDGIFVEMTFTVPSRNPPANIYPLKDAIATFVDSLSSVYPGNHLQFQSSTPKGPYKDIVISLTADKVSPTVLGLMATKMKDLPFVLQKMTFTVENGDLSGPITIEALGS